MTDDILFSQLSCASNSFWFGKKELLTSLSRHVKIKFALVAKGPACMHHIYGIIWCSSQFLPSCKKLTPNSPFPPCPSACIHFQGQRFSDKRKSLIIICTSYRYRSRTQEEVRSKNWVESDMRHLTFIYGKKKSEHSTHLSQSEHGAAAAKSFFIPLDKLLDCCVRDLHVRCHNGSFFVWTWWDCNKVKLHILQLCHL